MCNHEMKLKKFSPPPPNHMMDMIIRLKKLLQPTAVRHYHEFGPITVLSKLLHTPAQSCHFSNI